MRQLIQSLSLLILLFIISTLNLLGEEKPLVLVVLCCISAKPQPRLQV
jgi:hypothetical protein